MRVVSLSHVDVAVDEHETMYITLRLLWNRVNRLKFGRLNFWRGSKSVGWGLLNGQAKKKKKGDLVTNHVFVALTYRVLLHIFYFHTQNFAQKIKGQKHIVSPFPGSYVPDGVNSGAIQGQIQDFKIGGVHLKKLRRAEGGAKIFGVFRVKNHNFTPKNYIFSNFRRAHGHTPGAPPLDSPLQ